MPEAAGSKTPSRLDVPPSPHSGGPGFGGLKPDWLLLDLLTGTWLAYAFAIFRGSEATAGIRFAVAYGLIAGIVRWLVGGHVSAVNRLNRLNRLGRMTGALLLLGLHAWITGGWTTVAVTSASAAWLACATGLTGGALRLALGKLHPPASRHSVGEAARWLVLAGLTIWVYALLYTDTPLGAGDSYWYKLMLADFITQVRTVGLPVWVGQTEYAFNGTVIPVRMAPWFQHFGAFADWLTFRALPYVALNNLQLAINALAGAFSAYFCFRALVPRQPWNAAAIAFLYIASPGILAPLTNCDQYMTFLATPFLPVAAYALWRICHRDQWSDYLLLAAALAALWQTHPPIALCMCFFAATGGAARLLVRRNFRWPHAVLALVVFLVLGSLPFVSVFSLGMSRVDVPLSGSGIDYETAAVFRPMTAAFQFYQPGFAALLLGGLGLGVFVWRRTQAAGIHLFLITLLIALALPIPVVNDFLWDQVPRAAMQVLNLWPIQRLVGIWVILLLTLGLGSLALLESARRTWLPAACFWSLLVPGALWSGWQATYPTQHLRGPAVRNDAWRKNYEKHNLVLSRYAFNPFPTVPGYFSHGYIDPVLEHRLLRQDLTPLVSNAESAVRRGPLPLPDPDGSALLAQGTWRAVNDNRTDFYNLQPTLSLPAQQHLALRLEPLDPGQPGWLQIFGQDVFREYILPDSGTGGANRPALRGFGTLPASSKVISLYTRHPQETPHAINIAPGRQPAHTDFDFARYELWRYDPADLPIMVDTWVPYRLIVHSPEPGYLETTRAWLPHYRAKINGQRVYGTRSPEGLVMFAVPAGRSDITIKYVPPLWLELTYWLNLGGWVGLLVAGLGWLLFSTPAGSLTGSRPAGC